MNTGQILLFKIYVFYGYCFQYSIYHSIYQQYRVCVSVFVRLNPFETVAKLQMNINTRRLVIECGRERECECVCDLNTKCWVFLFKQWMIHYHHCILLLCVKHKIIYVAMHKSLALTLCESHTIEYSMVVTVVIFICGSTEVRIREWSKVCNNIMACVRFENADIFYVPPILLWFHVFLF